MNVLYDDADKGRIILKGAHIDMALPASVFTPESSKVLSRMVDASGEIKAVMPELAAIDACISGKLSSDQKQDKDIYLNTALSCVEAAPASKEPVPIIAYVKLGLTKEEGQEAGAWVVGEITYSAPAAGPGGKMTIPLMPGDCKVVP